MFKFAVEIPKAINRKADLEGQVIEAQHKIRGFPNGVLT
jgi:hypothetical protein